MKTILVAIDFSSVTEAMLEAATRMARALEAELCPVLVVPSPRADQGESEARSC